MAERRYRVRVGLAVPGPGTAEEEFIVTVDCRADAEREGRELLQELVAGYLESWVVVEEMERDDD